MAVEIFLKLDGIDGESEKQGAEKLIEIFSFSNGASNPSSVAFGTGSGAGKVDISSLSLQKQLDKASPKLFLSCCKGTHIKTGNMFVREATGDKTTQIYYQYDMTEVFVDSISWGGAAGGGKPSESLSLSCKSLTITYWPQDSTGKLGTKIPAGWDVSKNTEATS
ncbi:MAG: type VI secretion system tube protein Hcp [Acidobacteriaceae bacterium]|nr:type VI secretion system tube protein Hcp [Acidobacteriaceae bacterium]MBV9498081.1 type VI secretion system tube protein Hcp [Acidobacteriaceae bacterium]